MGSSPIAIASLDPVVGIDFEGKSTLLGERVDANSVAQEGNC